jgi:copper(I)-binding protein
MLLLRKHHTKFSFIRLNTLLTFLLFSCFSVFSQAEDSSIADHISFEKPWIRLLPPTVMHTAGYVTIKNSSDTPDKLLDVWSPTIDNVSVHQTKEVDGVFKMLAADNLEVPANGELTLKPGSYHIMIMGLDSPLDSTSTITICFEFEKAGIVHVVFPTSKTQI